MKRKWSSIFCIPHQKLGIIYFQVCGGQKSNQEMYSCLEPYGRLLAFFSCTKALRQI